MCIFFHAEAMALHSKSGRKSADRLGKNPRRRKCISNSSQSRHSTAHQKPKGRGGSPSGPRFRRERAVLSTKQTRNRASKKRSRKSRFRKASTALCYSCKICECVGLTSQTLPIFSRTRESAKPTSEPNYRSARLCGRLSKVSWAFQSALANQPVGKAKEEDGPR